MELQAAARRRPQLRAFHISITVQYVYIHTQTLMLGSSVLLGCTTNYVFPSVRRSQAPSLLLKAHGSFLSAHLPTLQISGSRITCLANVPWPGGLNCAVGFGIGMAIVDFGPCLCSHVLFTITRPSILIRNYEHSHPCQYY